MGQHILDNKQTSDFLVILSQAIAAYRLGLSKNLAFSGKLAIDLIPSSWAFNFRERLSPMISASHGMKKTNLEIILISDTGWWVISTRESFENDQNKQISDLVVERTDGTKDVPHTVLVCYVLEVEDPMITRICFEISKISSDAQKKIKQIILQKISKQSQITRINHEISMLVSKKKELEAEAGVGLDQTLQTDNAFYSDQCDTKLMLALSKRVADADREKMRAIATPSEWHTFLLSEIARMQEEADQLKADFEVTDEI